MHMKNLLILSFVVFTLFLFTGCPNGHRYEEGRFPYDPVNFEEVNSEYDDYNSTSPVIEGYRYLYFSSNRNSQQGNFDIVGSHLHILWDKEDGKLTVNDQADSWKNYDYVDSLFYRINTQANEYGPYSLYWTAWESSDYNEYYTDLVIYSNDEPGHLDLNLAYFRGTGAYPQSSEGYYKGPEPIVILNSAYNDAYLAFYGPSFIMDEWGSYPQYITEALFCSDRNGDFDIYMAPVPADSSLIGFLTGNGPVTIATVPNVNTGSHEKCPYVNGQLLVFASDRPGGYGGFDLYYSQRIENSWTEPVNFGSRVNSAFNEYRPIILAYYEFQNDLMIYSSDRPGGKGGYDLYYVGISKMIDWYYLE